ncbi:MAG: GTP-binding protein [bacterium]|nr:GTP-binding protein [bacterium]
MIINRDNIGIFGKMNAGKSSVMNLLTQQETSIVDNTPGTTADTKITLQEIHGLGPVKLFDTAGLDELNELGEKKREKVFSVLKECDLIILVINPLTKEFSPEKLILEKSRDLDKQILIVYNLFHNFCADQNIVVIENSLNILKFYSKIKIFANNTSHRAKLLNFILSNYVSKNKKIELLPFVEKDEFYILNIPMDDETPPGRFLRPQAMCEEYITRNWSYPVSYRMNLRLARKGDKFEKDRFIKFINSFKQVPKVIITDSQAMDIMKDWTPDTIRLTTFSIVMINYMSNGNLRDFVTGVKQLDSLNPGNKVLIVEACNHSRIGEDIGTVQIPNYFKEIYPEIIVEHNFGREFQNNKYLSEYKLIIHCGGCMISYQKLASRLRDLSVLGIPYTNYGVFLSYIHGEKILDKVLDVWEL